VALGAISVSLGAAWLAYALTRIGAGSPADFLLALLMTLFAFLGGAAILTRRPWAWPMALIAAGATFLRLAMVVHLVARPAREADVAGGLIASLNTVFWLFCAGMLWVGAWKTVSPARSGGRDWMRSSAVMSIAGILANVGILLGVYLIVWHGDETLGLGGALGGLIVMGSTFSWGIYLMIIGTTLANSRARDDGEVLLRGLLLSLLSILPLLVLGCFGQAALQSRTEADRRPPATPPTRNWR
jgi:hypothetical protein